MKHKLLGLASFALLAPIAMQAQTTGTLSGKVTGDDGKPVAGATIVILGTSPTRGAIAKSDGTYLIAGVRADDTQSRVLFLGPQMGFTFGPRWSLELRADFPVHIENSSIQTTVGWRGQAALVAKF